MNIPISYHFCMLMCIYCIDHPVTVTGYADLHDGPFQKERDKEREREGWGDGDRERKDKTDLRHQSIFCPVLTVNIFSSSSL